MDHEWNNARSVVIALAALFAARAWGEASDAPSAPNISSVSPPTVQRGTAITLAGTLPGNAVFYLPPKSSSRESPQPYDCATNVTESRIQLVAAPAVTTTTTTPAGTTTSTSFNVLIPDALPLGNYALCAKYTSAGAITWYTVPILGDSGRLQVTDAPGAVPVQVTSVPRVVYEKSNRYRFYILGNGFSRIGPDNAVLLNGRELPLCWGPDPECEKTPDKARGTVISVHQLDLDLPGEMKKTFPGSQTVQVRIGINNENAREGAPSVTLARISSETPRWIALGVVVVLALLVIVILGMNQSQHTVAGRNLTLLQALLLDAATDTYSLSRAQFYAWTSAAVFGYSYLTIAWTYLQGRLEFAPVPQNLPGIILASAGTAAIAEGINRGKPKGADGLQPSLRDFITTGGLLVPDRLQFLVWTIVGVITFILLIVASDPATVATLPSIPNDFLTLMGISSAGYLGGRLARQGGPVIDDILATLGSLKLELHGRFLSKNASFQIDGQDVTLEEIDGAENSDHLPKVVAKDDSAQDANMAKVLVVTIEKPKAEWLTRKSNPDESKRTHILSVINPDGQKAQWTFAISAGPTAVLAVNSSGGQRPVNDTLTVTTRDELTFDASGSGSEDGKLGFTWTVDGIAANADGAKLKQPANQLAVGTHIIAVKVLDSKQVADTASIKVIVKPA